MKKKKCSYVKKRGRPWSLLLPVSAEFKTSLQYSIKSEGAAAINSVIESSKYLI
jgi:hypothetical protein